MMKTNPVIPETRSVIRDPIATRPQGPGSALRSGRDDTDEETQPRHPGSGKAAIRDPIATRPKVPTLHSAWPG